MDLRRRLIGMLALLLGSLLAVTAVIQLLSLRTDVAAEIDASTRLVNLLAAAADPAGAASLGPRLVDARLRHLSIRTPDQPAAPVPFTLLIRLGLVPPAGREQAVRIGGRVLLIAPNPRSEISERLANTAQILNTLLFFSCATLWITWWCADRALAPVRTLEAGLQRLARGEQDPALPAFALREFGRVARAIEQLASALADARAAQRTLARRLIALQEEERRTLARELHDEIGQTLTALNLTVAHLARHAGQLAPAALADCAVELRRDLRTCREQLRGILRSLRPHGLDTGGLARTLDELVHGWQGRHTGIDFTLDLPPGLPDVGEPTALMVYRVVQEALTNVVRHSGAGHCTVRIAAGAAVLALDIGDDGRGLPSDVRWHGGLLGMRERVEMAGGTLHALPNAGGGLCLRALFPLAAGNAQPSAATAGALP